MIYDTFEHADMYFADNPLLHKAISYASQLDPATPDGRYSIERDNLFALVASYETSPAEERQFEAHKKYIDVQVILKGGETIGVSLASDLSLIEAYSEENDVMFFESPGAVSTLVMKPGYFAVFYPHDIHRPNCLLQGKQTVRKVVVKVKI
jgi:YhcH/YjgK/YiaL family protein